MNVIFFSRHFPKNCCLKNASAYHSMWDFFPLLEWRPATYRVSWYQKAIQFNSTQLN